MQKSICKEQTDGRSNEWLEPHKRHLTSLGLYRHVMRLGGSQDSSRFATIEMQFIGFPRSPKAPKLSCRVMPRQGIESSLRQTVCLDPASLAGYCSSAGPQPSPSLEALLKIPHSLRRAGQDIIARACFASTGIPQGAPRTRSNIRQLCSVSASTFIATIQV